MHVTEAAKLPPWRLGRRPDPHRVGLCALGPLVVRALADAPQLHALVVERRRLHQVAAALLDLLGALLEQDAEVVARDGVHRIRRDRRAVRRLRAVEVM